MRRLIRVLPWLVAAVCGALLLTAFGLEASYASRAKLFQRVEPSAEAELFGEIGEKIGSPQLMIVDDPAAVLPERGEGGVALLDESYLREKGIYPLQLQTVRFVAYWVKLGSGVVGVLALVVGVFMLRRARRAANPAQGAG